MKELELKTGSSVVDIKARLLALEEVTTRAIYALYCNHRGLEW
ncbi:hypothetical protein UY416_09490 [Paenibacillus polymyxa]|nr:hypothetical protein [Paenibacillus polymyxa]MDY8046525.1 hypothetical protein [Paenibacillus polymyxa]